jgi:tRNA-dihydrouridine synthase
MAAMPDAASLNDRWTLGTLEVPNRVILAPLAGIGNWFVRLQAKRYGAGMAVSEMVSSHAIHYGNERTCNEMLRIDAREAGGLPVTVKLRSGLRAGETSGFDLAHRLVEEAGVAAIAFHPRSAAVQHKGVPDYELVARLAESLPAPVILTGGLSDAEQVRRAFRQTGVQAVMLARGALGNPWLFAQLVHGRELEPAPAEVLAELDWVIDRAVEHLGEGRATRYLRKFYPWYIGRLKLESRAARRMLEGLQTAPTLREARGLLDGGGRPVTLAF